jgi:hypothetical protein
MNPSFLIVGDCYVQQKQFAQAIPTYQKVEQLLDTSKLYEKKCGIAIKFGVLL